MNIRTFTLLIAFIVLPTLAQASDRRGASPAVSERAALLQTIDRGANISSNNQQYQVLLGVRAAQKRAKEQPEQTITRLGGGKLVETKGTFVLFTAAQQSPTSVKSVNGISYPTVVNTNTGGIGVMPGTLSVKLKDANTATAVAEANGLEVVRVFARLKTAFFRVKTGQDVVAAAAALAADARVESAEVEVLEHMNVPH